MGVKNIMLWVLLFLCIAGIAYSIPHILRYTLRSDEPIMTIISRSMWPALNRGDVVFVKHASPADIQVGTVVVFRHKGGLAVHRVVEVDGQRIITKGDANTDVDAPITYKDIVGRVPTVGSGLVKIPYIGRLGLLINPDNGVSIEGESVSETGGIKDGVIRYLGNPMVIALLVLYPIILILISSIWSLRMRLKPDWHRVRIMQERKRRLEIRWGKDRVQRALGR
jgi:signal peptidase